MLGKMGKRLPLAGAAVWSIHTIASVVTTLVPVATCRRRDSDVLPARWHPPMTYNTL